MKKISIIILIFCASRPFAQDSLIISKTEHSLYLLLGSNPSIFNLGYGLELKAEKKVSTEIKAGFGVDFLRYKKPYYNFELLLKLRVNYNFNLKHTVYVESGAQYLFNPWYIKDSAKFYPNCGASQCPESFFNIHAGIGYQYSFNGNWRIGFNTTLNYYQKSLYILPGIELKYKL